MTYPSGMVLDYSYLPQGGTRIVTAGLPGEQTTIAIQTDLQVDELGRVKLRSLGNSTNTTNTYKDFLEGANRLNSIQSATETGATFQNYTYEYDGVGNITKIKDTEETYRVFTYDEMNRLLTSIGVGGIWAGGTYDIATSYDPTTGNLSSKGGNSYSYDAAKPHAVISDGSRTFTYDANGNATDITPQTVRLLDEDWEITTAAVSRSYTYNAEGKLIAYSNNDAMEKSYIYDGDGQRTLEQNSNGSMIFFMGNYLEQHLPGSSSEKWENIYADGVRLAVRINEASNTDNFYWFHLDHLGGTHMITRGNGEVSTTYLYDAWGGMYYEQGQGTVTDRLYTDQPRIDDDHNLYYYGARWPQVNRDLFSDGCVILFERIKQDLLDGFIKTLP